MYKGEYVKIKSPNSSWHGRIGPIHVVHESTKSVGVVLDGLNVGFGFDEVESPRLSTVNVIEVINEDVQRLTALPESPEGNKAAEDLFKTLIKEHTANVTLWDDEDLQPFIEEGLYDDGQGYQVLLVHST